MGSGIRHKYGESAERFGRLWMYCSGTAMEEGDGANSMRNSTAKWIIIITIVVVVLLVVVPKLMVK